MFRPDALVVFRAKVICFALFLHFSPEDDYVDHLVKTSAKVVFL